MVHRRVSFESSGHGPRNRAAQPAGERGGLSATMGVAWGLRLKRVNMMVAAMASLLFTLLAPAAAQCNMYCGSSSACIEEENACNRARRASEQSAEQARKSDAIQRENGAAADRNAKIAIGFLAILLVLLVVILVRLFCCKKTQKTRSGGALFCCRKNQEMDSLGSSLLSASQPPDQTTGLLSAFLTDALLTDYEDALRELGCAIPTDLNLVEDVELEKLGMKKIEIRRLRALAPANGVQPSPHSLGFTGFE